MSSSNLKSVANPALKPAPELARASGVRFPNESVEYRRARQALLAEEIELRRHIERVAEQRRALPPGGEDLADHGWVHARSAACHRPGGGGGEVVGFHLGLPRFLVKGWILRFGWGVVILASFFR